MQMEDAAFDENDHVTPLDDTPGTLDPEELAEELEEPEIDESRKTGK
jgi:hypothetical protein